MRKFIRIIKAGTIFTLTAVILTACQKSAKPLQEKEENNSNTFEDDAVTAPPDNDMNTLSLTSVNSVLTVKGSESYSISSSLYGLFLEDINYAVDGGLYAEMVKNRSFEFGKMASDAKKHGWSILGNLDFTVADGSLDESFLNQNNTHYAVLQNKGQEPSGIRNSGFLEGMAVEAGKTYLFSAYFKSADYKGPVSVQLADAAGNIYGEAVIQEINDTWHKYEAAITADKTVTEGLGLIVLMNEGSLDADMISLFPKDTFGSRENGLRKDLVETLKELSPKFLRFPGGCVVEGKTLLSAYSWKDSIGNGMAFTVNGKVTYGDVAARPLGINLWGNENAVSANPYYMTYGLGFYEYFLLCEDIGAMPVPILNAGLSCLIQGTRAVGTPADSVEPGTEEFAAYVQDALDLVEFCKGDKNTKWGAIRIAMGHEEPFELTYIGIGNEQWGNVYYNRYEAFLEAFRSAAAENPKLYGNIQLIVANGPSAADTFAWNKIKLYGNDYAGLVDEHYYMTPSWFLLNTNRYDTYDRNNTPVFLGEYAAKSNTAEAALAEAAFMTGLERNGDIVKLASYAPLFGNTTASQWSPDLIWFNNHSSWGSVNYYVQKLFGNNSSTKIIKSSLTGSDNKETVKLTGKIGVGTWMTAAEFKDITVTDTGTGKSLYTDEFSADSMAGWKKEAGLWSVKNGSLIQSGTASPVNNVTGDVIYTGDTDWQNYTLTLTAVKTGGSEGFLIPFAVQDKNNFYHWNIGGWNNTVSCLEQTVGRTKSGQIAGTVKNFTIHNGTEYKLKVVVKENTIKCYLNDMLMVNYSIPATDALYHVCGRDENDLIIKLVNVSGNEQKILITPEELQISKKEARLSLLKALSPGDMNTEDDPERVSIIESTLNWEEDFIYSAPPYSVSVVRIPIE